VKARQSCEFGRFPDQRAAPTTPLSPKYYSKPLFRPWFSLCALFMSLFILSHEIFYPCILKTYEFRGFLILLMEITAIVLALTYFFIALFTLGITPEGISQCNHRRIFVRWENLKSIKVKKILGNRILYIQDTKKQNTILIFASPFHRIQQVLQHIQHYVEDDHPLVKALEQEIVYPQQRPHRMAWRMIAAIVLLISTWLIGGNLLADRLAKPLEQAIAQYNSQHPTIAPNASAHQLQSLLVKFGLSLDHFDDGSKVKVEPDKAAITEWQVINQIADKYLDSQINITEDRAAITPLPQQLSAYLKTHHEDIKAFNDYWNNEPKPDLGQGYPYTAETMRLVDLYKIVAIDIINSSKVFDTDITKELVAMQKGEEFLRSQPPIIQQLAAIILEKRTAKLTRTLKNIPVNWRETLSQDDRHQKMLMAIQDDNVITNALLQNPVIVEQDLQKAKSPWWWLFRYHHLVQPYLRVVTSEQYQKLQAYLADIKEQDICHVRKAKEFHYSSPILQPLYGVMDSRVIFRTATNDLHWELTNGVRQVRTKFAAGQKAAQIASEFNLPSQVCLGEKWSAQAKNNFITISFSHPPNWQALGMQSSFDRLIYTIHP
jgi:hypothetical protein